MRNTSEGIYFLHVVGQLLHNDIKPQNILVKKDNVKFVIIKNISIMLSIGKKSEGF